MRLTAVARRFSLRPADDAIIIDYRPKIPEQLLQQILSLAAFQTVSANSYQRRTVAFTPNTQTTLRHNPAVSTQNGVIRFWPIHCWHQPISAARRNARRQQSDQLIAVYERQSAEPTGSIPSALAAAPSTPAALPDASTRHTSCNARSGSGQK